MKNNILKIDDSRIKITSNYLCYAQCWTFDCIFNILIIPVAGQLGCQI